MPRSLRPDLPPRLEDAILKTLEKDRIAPVPDRGRAARGSHARQARQLGRRVRARRHASPSALSRPRRVSSRRRRNSARDRGRLRWGARVALLTVGLVVAFAAREYFFRTPAVPPTPPPASSGSLPVPPAGGAGPAGQPAAGAVTVPLPPPPTSAPQATPPAVRPPDTPPRGAPPPEPRMSVPPQPAATPPPPPAQDAPPIASDAGRLGPGGLPPGRAGRRGARGPLVQLQALSTLLQTQPPEKYDVVYAAGDLKSQELALQLKAAIDKGGWTAVSAGPIREPQALFGIFVPRHTPGTAALINWARRAGLEPDVRLVARLPHVHIVVGRHQN